VRIELAENQSNHKTSNNLSGLTLKQNQETRQAQAVDRVNDLTSTLHTVQIIKIYRKTNQKQGYAYNYLPIPQMRLEISEQGFNWSQKRHAHQRLLVVVVRSHRAPPSSDHRAGHQQLVKHEARNANGIHHSEDAVVCLHMKHKLFSCIYIYIYIYIQRWQIINYRLNIEKIEVLTFGRSK
jgi:hypothetical protein